MELVIPLLLVFAVIELFLSGRWSRFYFTIGVPIFRRRVPVASLGARVEERLEAAHDGGLSAPLIFRRLSGSEIAFREKAFGFHLLGYTPVMHGLIRYDPAEGTVHVIGFANWFVLVFASAWLVLVREFEPMLLAVLVLGLGLIYSIQAYRYASVARFLDSAEERSNVRTP